MTYEVSIYSTRNKERKEQKQPKKQFFLGRNPFRSIPPASEKVQLEKSETEVLDYLNSVIFEAEYEDDSDAVSKQDLNQFRAEELCYENGSEDMEKYDRVKIAYKRPVSGPTPVQHSASLRSWADKPTYPTKASATEDAIDKIVNPAWQPHLDEQLRYSANKTDGDEAIKRQLRKNSSVAKKGRASNCPTIRGFDGFMLY